MKINDFVSFYFDHERFRRKVKAILIENDLTAEDIAPSIGYAERTVINYLHGANDSRFVAGALCDRFDLNPKDFMKEGY